MIPSSFVFSRCLIDGGGVWNEEERGVRNEE